MDASVQTEWARLVIDGLVHAGVRDAVISPGSRSTPFTCAALEHPRLQCTSGWDERAAAHFALGQARATGVPSLIICTSGSAAANYFPAVVEAFEAGVPLVMLTADRPAELHGCGANQTTAQQHMFGQHVRFFAHLGEAEASKAALKKVWSAAIDAVVHAKGTPPGPVHLNAPAQKPLEPVHGADQSLHDVLNEVRNEAPPRLGAHLQSTGGETSSEAPIAQLHEMMRGAERGLLLAGPLPSTSQGVADVVVSVADAYGFAIAAESSSQLRHFPGARGRVLGAGDLWWRTEAGKQRFQPDVVVQLGETPVLPGWLGFRALSKDAPLAVVHPWKKADPSRTTELFVHEDPATVFQQLANLQPIDGAKSASSWWPSMCELDAQTRAVVAATLDASEAWSEARTVATAMRALPSGGAVVLGNSLPIRHVDMWTAPSDRVLTFFSQRGVSGIDGVVAAAGGALSKHRGPGLAIIGDISFLHSLNGLQMAANIDTPWALLLVNNQGGQIFRQLPIGDARPATLDYFTTPQRFELSHASQLYGLEHRVAADAETLANHLKEAFETPGCTVVEARVPSDSAARDNARLVAAVQAMFESM